MIVEETKGDEGGGEMGKGRYAAREAGGKGERWADHSLEVLRRKRVASEVCCSI